MQRWPSASPSCASCIDAESIEIFTERQLTPDRWLSQCCRWQRRRRPPAAPLERLALSARALHQQTKPPARRAASACACSGRSSARSALPLLSAQRSFRAQPRLLRGLPVAEPWRAQRVPTLRVAPLLAAGTATVADARCVAHPVAQEAPGPAAVTATAAPMLEPLPLRRLASPARRPLPLPPRAVFSFSARVRPSHRGVLSRRACHDAHAPLRCRR